MLLILDGSQTNCRSTAGHTLPVELEIYHIAVRGGNLGDSGPKSRMTTFTTSLPLGTKSLFNTIDEERQFGIIT